MERWLFSVEGVGTGAERTSFDPRRAHLDCPAAARRTFTTFDLRVKQSGKAGPRCGAPGSVASSREDDEEEEEEEEDAESVCTFSASSAGSFYDAGASFNKIYRARLESQASMALELEALNHKLKLQLDAKIKLLRELTATSAMLNRMCVLARQRVLFERNRLLAKTSRRRRGSVPVLARGSALGSRRRASLCFLSKTSCQGSTKSLGAAVRGLGEEGEERKQDDRAGGASKVAAVDYYTDDESIMEAMLKAEQECEMLEDVRPALALENAVPKLPGRRRGAATALLQQAIALPRDEKAVLMQGLDACKKHLHGKSRRLLQDAATIAKAKGNVVVEARALANLSIVFARQNQCRDALGFFREGLRILRQVRERALESRAISNGVFLCIRLGYFDEAMGLALRKMTIADQSHEHAKAAEWVKEIRVILETNPLSPDALEELAAEHNHIQAARPIARRQESIVRAFSVSPGSGRGHEPAAGPVARVDSVSDAEEPFVSRCKTFSEGQAERSGLASAGLFGSKLAPVDFLQLV